MTGRRNAQPDHQQQQYNRSQVSACGLACPFAKSDPDVYLGIGACRAVEGFKELRELNEHIWRKHTSFFRCGFCSERWSISTARGKVAQKKEKHWETCEGRRHGMPYFQRFEEDGTELLDWQQQRRFEEVKSIRGNDRKLKALYEACGKPVPDTYYVSVALPTAQQAQVTYSTVARTTATRHTQQQPDSRRGEFLAGFVQPRPEGLVRQSRRRTTANNVSRSDAQAAGGGYEVSGANRPPDTDSGYVSMPRNDADASDVSPADRYPSQQPSGAYHWSYAPSHTRPYEEAGNHAAATTGPVHLTGDGEAFGHVLYRECFDYGPVDPSLYGSAGPSNRVDDGSQALLGLALPDHAAADAEGPLNIWAFTNLDAEFPEHSGS